MAHCTKQRSLVDCCHLLNHSYRKQYYRNELNGDQEVFISSLKVSSVVLNGICSHWRPDYCLINIIIAISCICRILILIHISCILRHVHCTYVIRRIGHHTRAINIIGIRRHWRKAGNNWNWWSRACAVLRKLVGILKVYYSSSLRSRAFSPWDSNAWGSERLAVQLLDLLWCLVRTREMLLLLRRNFAREHFFCKKRCV